MTKELSAAVDGGVWQLRGPAAERFGLVNDFLGHLADRNFSAHTCRAYAYDLLAFARWLIDEQVELAEVNVDVLLRFLTACREATLPGRPGGNVYSIRDGRNQGYAPATINRRLAAISSCSHSRRCANPTRETRSVGVVRPDCVRVESVPACWRISPSRSHVPS
jgi:hypothetical protein